MLPGSEGKIGHMTKLDPGNVVCTSEDWLKYATAILTWYPPVQTVTLTTVLRTYDADKLGQSHYGEVAEEFLERHWPGITFTFVFAES